LDANADGDWDDDGEQVLTNKDLSQGDNTDISFSVPCPEDPPVPESQTFMRFRFSTAGSLSYDGLAVDGEVEDYEVEIYTADYGDAPEPYPTADAYHIVDISKYLGSYIDPECQALPNDDATGDDNYNLADEDGVGDGVSFSTTMILCQQVYITVTASVEGYLNTWIDFNADDDWNEPNERVFNNVWLSPGPNSLSFTVPCTAVPAITFARFRFFTDDNLQSYDGYAPDGEMEDYRVFILRPDEEKPEEGEVVGGDVYPVDKTALLAPWLALAVIILAGGVFLIRRRIHSYK
jgi:hypothetical protein